MSTALTLCRRCVRLIQQALPEPANFGKQLEQLEEQITQLRIDIAGHLASTKDELLSLARQSSASVEGGLAAMETRLVGEIARALKDQSDMQERTSGQLAEQLKEMEIILHDTTCYEVRGGFADLEELFREVMTKVSAADSKSLQRLEARSSEDVGQIEGAGSGPRSTLGGSVEGQAQEEARPAREKAKASEEQTQREASGSDLMDRLRSTGQQWRGDPCGVAERPNKTQAMVTWALADLEEQLRGERAKASEEQTQQDPAGSKPVDNSGKNPRGESADAERPGKVQDEIRPGLADAEQQAHGERAPSSEGSQGHDAISKTVRELNELSVWLRGEILSPAAAQEASAKPAEGEKGAKHRREGPRGPAGEGRDTPKVEPESEAHEQTYGWKWWGKDQTPQGGSWGTWSTWGTAASAPRRRKRARRSAAWAAPEAHGAQADPWRSADDGKPAQV